MKQLESLDIRSCRLQKDQLGWVLRQFPRLKRLMVDGKEIGNFVLSETDQLKEVVMTPLEQVKRVRLTDLPSLKAHLRIGCTPEQLEIRNVPSLRGLAVETAWPENAKIEGLRDLEWFAGGGDQIDDRLLDVILKCRSIDQLTLAYPSISKEKLVEIGRLPKLTLLSVPGADVDDSVTANWRSLQSLWEVNLDDTAISVRTLGWLSRIESLRRVSLNRVDLNEDAAEALSELRGVSELHLAGVDLDPQRLRGLIEAGNLESLNLSGWQVNESLMKVLSGASTLRHLILRNTSIDAASLDRLLASNPDMYVDLGSRPDFVSDDVESELQRRGQIIQRAFSSGWRRALQVTHILPDQEVPESPFFSSLTRAGRIDADVFRPIHRVSRTSVQDQNLARPQLD
jgi:hypothetical protein